MVITHTKNIKIINSFSNEQSEKERKERSNCHRLPRLLHTVSPKETEKLPQKNVKNQRITRQDRRSDQRTKRHGRQQAQNRRENTVLR